jgi:hypothetical protein
LPPPRLPLPCGDASHGPAYGDTPRIRPSPGIPGPGRGGGTRILKPETGEGAFAPSPSAPPPEAIPPTVQCMGKSLKREPVCGFPLPDTALLVCPSPVEIPPTVQCMGKSLKNELARGFPLPDTALLGYRHDCPRPSGRGRRPEAGRGGGCQYIETRDRGGGFCPLPVCPSPRGDTSHGPAYGEEPEEGASAGVYSPGYGFPRVSPARAGAEVLAY